MSLIPSESLNFPDSFRAKVGWRLGDEQPEDQQALEALRQAVAKGREQTTVPPIGQSQPAPIIPLQMPVMPSTGGLAVAEPTPAANSPTELVPNPPAEPPRTEPLTAEMSALLSHFLSSGAGNPSVSPNETAAIHSPAQPPPVASNPVVQPSEQLHDQAAEKVMAVEETKPETKEPSEPAVSAALAEQDSVISADKEPDSPATKVTPSSVPVRSLPQNSFKILREPAANGPSASSEPAPPQSPAPSNHLFDLIAAAVQRGTLVGELAPQSPVPDVSEPAVASAPSPETAPIESEPVSPAQVPDESPEMSSTTAEVKASDVSKAPAKIRITPRKNIKPHVSATEPAPQTAELPFPLSDETVPEEMMSEEPFAPWGIASKPPRVMASPVSPVREEPFLPMEYPDMPARKPTVSRLELNRSNAGLFTERDRWNRWIGFGLAEAVALTVLILLGWFGFTHHFPDPTVKLLVFILLFAAAAIAITLPIVFIRNSPSRWQRER